MEDFTKACYQIKLDYEAITTGEARTKEAREGDEPEAGKGDQMLDKGQGTGGQLENDGHEKKNPCQWQGVRPYRWCG